MLVFLYLGIIIEKSKQRLMMNEFQVGNQLTLLKIIGKDNGKKIYFMISLMLHYTVSFLYFWINNIQL